MVQFSRLKLFLYKSLRLSTSSNSPMKSTVYRTKTHACLCIYTIFIHRSSPIRFLLQGIVLPSYPYLKPRFRKLKRYGGGRRVAASYVLFICKPNAATELPLTKDYPSHDLKPRTKQSHLTSQRLVRQSIFLY
jgi:hypothetical protein